ncbi:hypothetical protein FO013_12655 [Brevibacterium aurantiacum]|uniref:Uncharacterized protein n=1 Tax=Brevibacterium aurantiacum TaxID=273384 RepID=A0A556CDV5_BREAU|nr:hypothetical protein FO013_12655 [Brevibacterium aurantiacum]
MLRLVCSACDCHRSHVL